MSMHGHFRLLTPAQVAQVRDDPGGVMRLLGTEDPRQVDVHKAWHGLHYLLTGAAGDVEGPLGFVACGGERVGDDLGVGPARVFDADAVLDIATALEALGLDEVAERFSPERMTQLE